jgi:hypothetical protein
VEAIIGAVNGVKDDLVSRLDSQIGAELKGKARTAVTSVSYLRNPVTAGSYTLYVNDAAHVAVEYLEVVGGDAAIDTVGRSMVTLWNDIASLKMYSSC